MRELTLDWPLVPFGPVAEVSEASDAEDELIAAWPAPRCWSPRWARSPHASSPPAPGCGWSRSAGADRSTSTWRRPGGTACGCASRPAATPPPPPSSPWACCSPPCAASPQAHDLLARQGSWAGSSSYTYADSGPELEDLPVGLVGYGAVGSRVARVLCAFGARVMVYDPYVRGEVHGLRLSSLDDLLRRSAVVTLHARLTAETRGLIGARELALLPPGAVVVNAARGPLLDEDALCDALEAGRLSAAALDTYAREPLPPDSRLRALADRVVLTPSPGRRRPRGGGEGRPGSPPPRWAAGCAGSRSRTV